MLSLGSADQAMPIHLHPVQLPPLRYHEDKVPLRLLCTYVGPGTEWLDDRHVDRWQLYSNTQRHRNEAISRGNPPLQAQEGHPAVCLCGTAIDCFKGGPHLACGFVGVVVGGGMGVSEGCA